LHIRSLFFIIQENLYSAEIELLPGMSGMKVWRMGDKVSNVGEKMKLGEDPGWKDSSGVEEICIWLREEANRPK
jgi:hypothetical protein